jgi:hypothetical protein
MKPVATLWAWAQRLVGLAALGACGVLLTGCPPATSMEDHVRPPAVLPSYAELAQGYNHKIAGLHQVWAATSVHLTWIDDKGERHSERGEGNLIVVLPDKTAFTFGKVGQTGLWAGCDARRYWYFDFRGDGVAYIGRHEHAGADSRNPMGVPIRPREVPKLLGIIPLDPQAHDAGGSPPAVRWDQGAYLVDVTATDSRLRLWIDPQTDLARSIQLLDSHGRPTATASLSVPNQLPTNGVPEAQWPWINTALHVELADDGGTLDVHLNSASDGLHDGGSKIKPIQFNFEGLVHIYDPARIVDLDRQSASQSGGAGTVKGAP